MVSLKEKLGFLCVWQQGSRQPVLSYNPSWAGAPSGRIISKLISFESLFYHFEIICIIFAFTSALYFSTHMSRLPCGAVGGNSKANGKAVSVGWFLGQQFCSVTPSLPYLVSGGGPQPRSTPIQFALSIQGQSI